MMARTRADLGSAAEGGFWDMIWKDPQVSVLELVMHGEIS
jgi:hypothetical protein